MSWPIGYTDPDYRFRATLDGTLFAQGVRVTSPRGWIIVQVPESPTKPGTVEVAVRLRLSVDNHGHPFLYAEELACRGKEYPGVHALIRETGPEWVEPLRRCVFAEIARRSMESPLSKTERPKPPEPREMLSLSADDTWESVQSPLSATRR